MKSSGTELGAWEDWIRKEKTNKKTPQKQKQTKKKKKENKSKGILSNCSLWCEVCLDPPGNPLETLAKCKMVHPRKIRVFIEVALWSVNASHKIVYVLEYLISSLRDSTQQFQRSLKAGSEENLNYLEFMQGDLLKHRVARLNITLLPVDLMVRDLSCQETVVRLLPRGIPDELAYQGTVHSGTQIQNTEQLQGDFYMVRNSSFYKRFLRSRTIEIINFLTYSSQVAI